jgi:formate--tetrahydrofolate ligase
MLSDIEIAEQQKLKAIDKVASDMGLKDEDYDQYGKYKAKINQEVFDKLENRTDGKIILVTSTNPTPAGEGKTTVSIGLLDAFRKMGYNAVAALREPSLGPVFGVKGGATGGGYAQVLPMEDINLNFTGDFHAITSANNLCCAMLDNHIYRGNKLNVDINNVKIKRCMDMNDRALRHIVVGLGGKTGGIPREDGFTITAACEVMAVLCLSHDMDDMKKRLGNIVVAFDKEKKPIYARDIKADGAMAAILKDAINPNLVQTIEGNPVLVHGGPFANIAHGCNSVRATRLAMKSADYCITEAGFGSELGAEKFFDIVCREENIKPSCTVIVSTIRALKYNGGVKVDDLNKQNIEKLMIGIENLGAHINIMKKFKIPVIVALNRHYSDTDEEIEKVHQFCQERGVKMSICNVFTEGGNGGIELATAVKKAIDIFDNDFLPLYPIEMPISEKINTISKEIYGADKVEYSAKAKKSLDSIISNFGNNYPVCVAKTQYSLSDDPKLLGCPKHFAIKIEDLSISNGAGFIVAYAGNILTMPGLPSLPAAENITIDSENKIHGLF